MVLDGQLNPPLLAVFFRHGPCIPTHYRTPPPALWNTKKTTMRYGTSEPISFPADRCLHELLTARAQEQPDKPALIFRNESMSFSELDRRSTELALVLQESGVGVEDFVAIYCERSFELIVAIFGILKAGGAYVPIDVDYPNDRMAFMVQDAGAKVILTQSHLAPRLPDTGARVISLDEPLPESSHTFKKPAVEPHHLAYMIYTSGSTGRPKGVMITHENVCYQLQGQQAIAPAPIDKMLLTVSISFDVSVLTIFWSLLQGATLVLPEQGEEKDMVRLAETIRRNAVTHTMTLPSPYTLLLDQAPPGSLDSLRLVNVSGEVCPVSLAQRHERLLPNTQLYNLYGPTEATVNCTYFTFPKGFDAEKAPIGIPIEGYDIFILDEQLKPLAAGEVGEIYIGGSVPVVGRGYWNRPELTAERFIERPEWLGLPEHPRARTLYKTGDLARWMPDGNIDFLGRSDFQVKFRGFRIELGEIEAALQQQPSVKEAVVLLRDEHDLAKQRLVAWLTLHDGWNVTVTELREHLAGRLPEYMLPSQFVFLDKMPLTTNGKFDRKALPDPPAERPALSVAYEAPKTGIEKYLAGLWEALLAIAPVGRNDKFFELGGNSILAARFLGRLMDETGASIFITSIFDHPTVAAYAAFLEKNYPEAVASLVNVSPSENTDGAADHERLTESEIEDFQRLVPMHLSEASFPSENGDPDVAPLFILAPPRSGTTLLRVMLAGHPALFACNELQLLHFETLRQRSEAYTGKFKLWSEGLIRAVMELKNCDAETAQYLLHELEEKGTTTAEMFRLLQEWSGGRTVADKSPSYALDPLALQKALRDFPKAKFIQLVRHPWSMVRSFEKYHMDQVLYLHPHNLSPRKLGELVWLHSQRNVSEFLTEVPDGQKSTILYEDLVSRPEATIRRMCEEIGIEFHPGLLDPYQDLDKKMTDGIYADSRSMGDTHFERKKGIDAQKAEEWKGVLKDNFLASQTWAMASRLGYPPPEQAKEKESTAESAEPRKEKRIAIIGMACRVAGARNVDEFWELLKSGKDPGRNVTAEDLAAEGLSAFPERQVLRTYALDDPYAFDHNFFGLHPREAAMMDPQHRHFLETAWEALESAGYDPRRYDGRIGLFGGVARNTYFLRNVLGHPELLEAAGGYQEMLASDSSFSVTRVAYKLNLKGPAVNVQTACSTGGVALHLACQSLQNGDANMVLVGGGRIQSPVNAGYEYTDGGPLSADGYLRAFDADANGMVQGQGMAMLLLKPLDIALADGDHIWAVIDATAINNDGADKTGITAPSSAGQAEVIETALRKAGISAEDISYVEAHGTGTFIGDPIEIQGLTTAFRRFTERKNYCAIGSVKTNVGHLDAGACIIGVIKTALALYHGELPPTLHFKKPNPQIDFANSPFFVNDRLRPWPRYDKPRRAGVSSFGLGGTNAHLILEEAPEVEPLRSEEESELLLLSARTENGLGRLQAEFRNFFESKPHTPIAAAAATTALGRSHFSHRSAFVIGPGLAFSSPAAKGQVQPGELEVAFLFPGGGAQYVNMGRELYESEPIFRREMDQCFELLKEQHGLDIRSLLYPDDRQDNSPIQAPAAGLAALFAVEYATARLWQRWGVQPAALLGHSMGEYTAACLAGVMDLETALGLVAVRGKLFESLPADGAMLSVPLSEEELKPWLGPEHCISVVNRHDSLVVSSTAEGIDQLHNKLDAAGIECTRLHIAVAAHSPQVEPILEAFGKYLASATLKAPALPVVSNVTGTWLTDEQAISVDYWLSHLRNTVRFHDGLSTLFRFSEEKPLTLLEAGPGQTLSGFARLHPQRKGQPVLASIRHPREQTADRSFILKSLAQLWVQGFEINWQHFYDHKNWRRLPLPTYPFEKQRHFLPPAMVATQQAIAPQKITTEPPTPEDSRPTMSQPTKTRKDVLIDEVRNILYELSGMDPESMDPSAAFLELGFDSLFLSQAVIRFNKRFNSQLSFRALFEEVPTIEALAVHLDESLPPGVFEPEVTPPAPLEGGARQEQPLGQLQQFQQSQQSQQSVKDSPLATLIQQQLNLMQQQLDLLRGTTQPLQQFQQSQQFQQPEQVTPLAPLEGGARQSQQPGQLQQSQQSQPQEIKRSTKGVTAKMSNYAKISAAEDLPERQRKGLEDFIRRYNKMTATSKKMQQRHRQFYADPRSVTGFSKLWKEVVYQIGLKKSKGAHIWDVDGNEYIDYVMSYGVGLFGHMPDFVEEAVAAALQRGNSLDVLPPEATEVARIICEMSGMDRVTLANTGTEAVLGAVRAARTASGRERIAVFDTDYHGMIDQFLVRGVHLKDKSVALPSSPGVPSFLVENNLVLDYDDPYALDKLKANIHELAAVVIEPVQAQNPHWQHDELIRQVREITREAGVALIFDEIINGFRLAKGGAQEWFGVEADIVAYGKSISGGLPLSAVAGKAKYMEAFDGGLWQYGDGSSPEGIVTYFASTFIKNPISVAAAHAAMQELERRSPELQEELNERTERFAKRIREIFLKTKAPFMIQSCSSFFMLKTADNNPLSRLFNYFLRMRGVNVRERPCFISTAHTDEDFERTYKAFEEAIQDMYDAGLIEPWEGEDLNVVVPPKVRRHADYPLTAGQEEIFVTDQLGKEASLTYNVGTEIRLEGELKREALEAALRQLIKRHEALRMSFSRDGSRQKPLPPFEPELPWTDLSHFAEGEKAAQLKALHEAETEAPFDLEKGPPVRFRLVKWNDQDHRLLITVHHIAVDGWSLGLLTRDVGRLYARACGAAVSLPSVKQLGSYALEQRAYQQGEDFRKNLAFWKEHLTPLPPSLELPTDRKRPSVKTWRSEVATLRIGAERFQQITKTAARQGTTFYFYVFAAFGAFLHKLSGQEDFVLGMIAAGHNLPGNDQLTGHAANLLPIRLRTDGNEAFGSFLKRTRGTLLDAFEHQNFTLGALAGEMELPRDPSRPSLVSVLFNLDSPLDQLQFGDLKATTRPIPRRYETFDIFVNISPQAGGKGLVVEWNFNADLWDRHTMESWLQSFGTLLDGCMAEPERPVGKLPLMDPPSLRNWVERGTGPAMDSPKATLHELVSAQARKTPDRVAVECQGRQLTYRQLEQTANRLANHFAGKGLLPGTFAAVLVDRNELLPAVLLAVLKCGAAYLPLDAANPTERLRFLLEDSGARLLISESRFRDILPNEPQIATAFIDEEKNHWQELLVQPPEYSAGPEDLAYMIYTSGSTGQPKGVPIRHSQAMHLITAMREVLDFNEEEKVFAVISATFDPSVQDIFMTLSNGARLIIAPTEVVKNGYLLAQELKAAGATFLQATPVTWQMLVSSGWQGLPGLKMVSGGEGLSRELAAELLKRGSRLWNAYGPTETTIYTLAKEISHETLDEPHHSGYVPIGRPLPDTRVFILDRHLQPLPDGIPGELYIQGLCVAGGYHRRPEKTEEAFITHPDFPEGKLYKTGDLVVRHANGDIEYINRLDNQVKLRGYRIELGEVEAVLRKMEGLQDCAVALRTLPNGEQGLVAYVVKKPGVNGIPIRDFLKKQLPDYMVPGVIMELPELPQTGTGKLDRRALPNPDARQLETRSGYEAPEGPMEVLLAELWKELLGVERISRHDNFFELGGHSLLAVRLLSAIEDKTGLRLPLVSLAGEATIAHLAGLLAKPKKDDTPSEPARPVVEDRSDIVTVPLTEGQREIYVSHHFSPEAAASFNIGSAIRLKGDLNLEALKWAIRTLAQRHEALRTSIDEGGEVQHIWPAAELEPQFLDFSDLPIEQRAEKLEALKKEQLTQPFDLSQAPLARFFVVKMAERDHVVLFVMHHIVLDGWSVGVLTADLGRLYAIESGYSREPLPPVQQLSEFALRQKDMQTSEAFAAARQYWLREFEGGVEPLNLPLDHPHSQDSGLEAVSQSVVLPKEEIEKAKALAAGQGATLYALMFAAFQAWLSRWCQQLETVVGVAVSGKSIVEWQDLVAHRTHLLPVRGKTDPEAGFRQHLKDANLKLLTAFDHQEYTLGTLVKETQLKREVGRHPLVSVVFNMETMERSYDFGPLEVQSDFIEGNYKLYDLLVQLKPALDAEGALQLKWFYNKSLFEPGSIQRSLNGFRAFFEKLLADPDLPLGRIDILPKEEKERLEKFGTGEHMPWPLPDQPQTLHGWLSFTASQQPEAVAVVCGTQQMTFAELERRSNQIANLLLQQGFEAGAYAGVLLEQSADILPAIYGVLKAGGAYVPLDASNPAARLRSIAKDAGISHLLTHSSAMHKSFGMSADLVVLDSVDWSALPADMPDIAVRPAANAYVIYTSGSTGQPKGVVIRHESALHTLAAINRHLKVGKDSVLLSVSSMAFDMSIPDYFLPATTGAHLVMATPDERKDGFRLAQALEQHRPTHMQATPATWRILLLSSWQGSEGLCAIAGGEALPKELAAQLLNNCRELWNGYGPTETTIYATYQRVDKDLLRRQPGDAVPIGKPIANVQVKIVGKDGGLVPIGSPGELLISGPGVSKGYLGRPELTAKAFVQDENGRTWYRSGDLVRWLPTGEIDFLGRIDGQVKLRGYRIELGEIEAALHQIPGVEQAAAGIVKDPAGEPQLAAWVVVQPGAVFDEKTFRDFLRKKLPPYMVPAAFVKMDELPLNNSLKVDRKNLPEPQWEQKRQTSTRTRPESETEKLLATLWEEVLGLKNPGVDEDFFEMGGHSLSAVNLLTRIHKATGKQLPLTVLFQHATIRELAELLEEDHSDAAAFSSLVPIRPSGNKPPLFLVHGGGLHVLFYQNMVRHLEPDQPIYALQARGLDGSTKPHDSIEDMAAHYIQEIRSVQPQGPYLLAGYSLGGIVAWEMARQLLAAGEEVPFLAVFDAVAKQEAGGSATNWKKKLKKTGFNLGLLLKHPIATVEYKSQMLKNRVDNIAGKLRVAYMNTKTKQVEEGYLPFGKEVYEKSMEAYHKYRLEPLDVQLDLFKARELMFYVADPKYYGWSKFARKGVRVHNIDGNHLTLFDRVHGEEIAKIVQRRLEEVAGVSDEG